VLSDDVLHMPVVCVLVKLSPIKIYVTHEWFWWLPIFLYSPIHTDYFKSFFTSEDKTLDTTSCQVFTTIKWLQL